MYVETYETSSQTILFSNKPRFYCHVCHRSLCAMANMKKVDNFRDWNGWEGLGNRKGFRDG